MSSSFFCVWVWIKGKRVNHSTNDLQTIHILKCQKAYNFNFHSIERRSHGGIYLLFSILLNVNNDYE